MRKFRYPTLGLVLLQLKDETGLDLKRSEYYRYEKQGVVPVYGQNTKGQWRILTPWEAWHLKKILYEHKTRQKYGYDAPRKTKNKITT